jgi:transcriptional regulator with XRE-family HTH domain
MSNPIKGVKTMSAANFAGRLRELREAAGLSQQAVADQTGLTVRQVSRLETGAQKPSWETVVALSRVLAVSCEAFLSEPSRVAERRPRGRPSKGQDRGTTPISPPVAPSAPAAGPEATPKGQGTIRGRRGNGK